MVTIGEALDNTCSVMPFTVWEERTAPPFEATIEVTEEGDAVVARADVGTDEWWRVRWSVLADHLCVEVLVGEAVHTSPVPLNAPGTYRASISGPLPAKVDVARAAVELTGGVLTVRLPRA